MQSRTASSVAPSGKAADHPPDVSGHNILRFTLDGECLTGVLNQRSAPANAA